MYMLINMKSLMKHHCLKKKIFQINLDMEEFTDSDYNHTKRPCQNF